MTFPRKSWLLETKKKSDSEYVKTQENENCGVKTNKLY